MKEFFKPTKAKIILALLIPLYFGVGLELATTGGIKTASYHVSAMPLPFIILFFVLISAWANNDELISTFNLASTGQKIGSFFLELLLPLVIAYGLACLLVYIWRQMKRSEGMTAKPSKNNKRKLAIKAVK